MRRTIAPLTALWLCGMALAAPQVVPFSRAGFIRADAAPETGSCTVFDLKVGVAWDYGNRSLVVEFPRPAYVTRVIVTADQASPHEPKLTRDTLRLYTSLDNRTYTLYPQPFTLKLTRAQAPAQGWTVEISGLQVLTRYLKLKQTYNGAEYGLGITNLTEAIQVFNDEGWGGDVGLDGLYVAPAQPAGHCVARVRVTTPRVYDFILQFEAENTETWEKLTWSRPVTPGEWTRVALDSEKLTPGGYWLRARLVFREAAVAAQETAFRVHTQCLNDAGGKLALPGPGGALVVRDLPAACEGGKAFSWSVPGEATEYRGLALEQGGKLIVKPPLSGAVAVYAALDNPWPDVVSRWSGPAVSVRATQDDWPVSGGVQEHFVGYGDFATGALTLEASGGPCRVHYLRLARLSPDELRLFEHVNDPTHNRRVIYNNDGFTELWGVKDWDRARLLKLVDRYADTDTEIFEMCAWVSSAVSFPSKFATFWKVGEVPGDQWVRDNDRMAVALYNQLEQDGLPIFPTLTARGKEIGVPVWGSLRMSAYYGLQEQQTLQPFNGKLWHEHPEYRLRRRDGRQAVELSFAHEAVRQERLGVLAEMAEMGCAGVMMDFCRYPYVLGYDEPLIAAFKAKYGVSPLDVPENDERWLDLRCAVLNDFFRAVRAKMNEIGQRQGRQIGISVRVPATGYREYGFDPPTWVRERLMDILIPHYPGLERDFDVCPWVELCRGTGLKVYPGIEVTKSQSSQTELTDAQIKRGIKPGKVTCMSSDDYRRKVWRRYRQGADGTFLFNVWTLGTSRNLLGDKVSLQKWSVFEDPMNLPRAGTAP